LYKAQSISIRFYLIIATCTLIFFTTQWFDNLPLSTELFATTLACFFILGTLFTWSALGQNNFSHTHDAFAIGKMLNLFESGKTVDGPAPSFITVKKLRED